MEITTYNSAKDSAVKDNLPVSFADICDLLTAYTSVPMDRAHKLSHSAFTYGRCENSRSNDNTKFISGIAADIDISPDDEKYLTFDDACDKLDERGKAYFAYTTTVSTRGHHRYRIVMPFASDVPAEQYLAAWELCDHRMRGRIDKSTKDPSRLSFMPAAWFGNKDNKGNKITGGFNAYRMRPEGEPVLTEHDIKNLPEPTAAGRRTAGTTTYKKMDLPDLSQGYDDSWAGWGIYMDLERSPYISPAWLNDIGDNRVYNFMVRCAGRAQHRKHPITTDALVMLAHQFESKILNREPECFQEYGRRAQYALAYVYRN